MTQGAPYGSTHGGRPDLTRGSEWKTLPTKDSKEEEEGCLRNMERMWPEKHTWRDQ